MNRLVLFFTALLIYISLVSCSGNYEIYEGWTGYDKELNNLTGFQPEKTIDIYSIAFRGQAAEYMEDIRKTLSEKQYYIRAEGKLITDNDYKSPDGEFIVYRILFLGDKNDLE